MTMDLGVSAKLVPLLEEVRCFIEKEILPVEVEFYEDIAVGDRWEWTHCLLYTSDAADE